MGDLDKKYLKGNKNISQLGFGSPQQKYNEANERHTKAMDVLSAGVGNITSRDQIVDPYSLISPDMYENTRRGRAQYESDLAALQNLQAQQQAAYDEFYNSPEQAAIREREAGLNPDLIGLENAGTAPDTNTPQTSPGSQLPTLGEQMCGALGSILSVFNTVSNISSVVSQIGLIGEQKKLVKEQKDAVFLSNASNFTSLASGAISDKLANAIRTGGDKFDMKEFFAGDFSDILSSLDPNGDPRYKSLFDRVLQHSNQVYSDAYGSLATSADGRAQFLNHLASKYYSDDDSVMIGQLERVVHAQQNLNELYIKTEQNIKDAVNKYLSAFDVQSAADAVDASNKYYTEYYNTLEADVMAELEQTLKQSESIIQSTTAGVYSYLGRQFDGPLSFLFPQRKQNIGWQILAGANFGWQDYLTATNFDYVNALIENLKASTEFSRLSGTSAVLNAEAASQNAETAQERQNWDAGLGIANILFNTASAGLPYMFGKKK